MKIVCVIPGLNEEKSIGNVILGASKYCDRVVVVDDGSQDKTKDISINSGAFVISHLFNLGTGAALSTGIKVALKEGADIVVTMDGDGQHDPEDIPNLLKPLMDGTADVVIGSRFLGNIKTMPFHKKIGNKFLSFITSMRCGEKITDSQSGFRAYSQKVLKSILHISADYSWASEFLMLIMNSEFRFVEVPIKTIYMEERIKGTGIIDGFKILMNMLRHKQEKQGI